MAPRSRPVSVTVRNALARTDGLSTVEYIIILCLIAIVCIAAWKRFGESAREQVNRGTTHVDTLGNTEN